MVLQRSSFCKVNLLLNILGRRSDGYHELETILLPVPLADELRFERRAEGIELTCNHPDLPLGSGNLVYRAAERFLAASEIRDGVRIHLEKRLPLAAGLGGGSANAATTLQALNELFGSPCARDRLQSMAAELGSDVPFFLQDAPALATGRGEHVQPLPPFELLRGCGLALVHPGFGVSTAWAYKAMAEFPIPTQGRVGRAQELIQVLRGRERGALAARLYNTLEAPVLRKFPLLRLLQDFFHAQGALGTLMSGSGSSTFAITQDLDAATAMIERARAHFGGQLWTASVAL